MAQNTSLRTAKAGERLRQVREELGWSQSEMANHLGVNRSYVNRLESGVRVPGRDLAVTIEREFGIEVAAWSAAA